ncbi:lipopolysaccharide biosynthesis protein [Zooshikella ganghwensis]|uniref:Lipopolysaccharide biosynthesis protein n=1 Tax=Zooshikella ganghwensis TaxID=202772 RepID=A0A4V1INU6_9GAMM|nr:lipopolysaccharide biosynthesis protein [Zooshikella ganghwensis]RDH44961.1 lipopolysaccharide biosynthesis protein [Zooshikella ganghwensis]
MVTFIRNNLAKLLKERLNQNLLWMIYAQFGSRLLRVICTIMVARMLAPDVYGLVALVLSINEMIHVLSHGGISGKIIQAKEKELPVLCNTGYWLNWLLCLGLTILQASLSWPIAWFYDNSNLILPIIVLSISYLFLPLGTIQAALLIRENRLNAIAHVEVLQSVIDALLTLILLIAGYGLWALVIPKLLVVPIWSWQMRYYHTWRPENRFSLIQWRSIFHFGKHLIWIDLLTALRNNIDYLIIGRLLGVEALGIYYFAFNAGLGLSQGLLRAACNAIYPHLCELQGQLQAIATRMLTSMRRIVLTFSPLILLQALLAPFYVPIIFGEKWQELGAIPLISILCLSAIPRLFSECCSQFLRACNKPSTDAKAQTLFTSIYTLFIYCTAHFSLLHVAWGVLASQIFFASIFVYYSFQLICPGLKPFDQKI